MHVKKLAAALGDTSDDLLALQARATAAADNHSGVRALVNELTEIIDTLVDIIVPEKPVEPPVKPPVEEKPPIGEKPPVE